MTSPSTPSSYVAFVGRSNLPTRRSFLVRVRESGALAGVVTLGDIVYRAGCSGFIGYFAFEPCTGKGYMSEGVALVLDSAFDELGLNRVEVNVQPGNVRSLALARRLGFRREGFSRKYLLIDGKFRDHVRTALLAEDWFERSAGLTARPGKRAPSAARTAPRRDRTDARGRRARGARPTTRMARAPLRLTTRASTLRLTLLKGTSRRPISLPSASILTSCQLKLARAAPTPPGNRASCPLGARRRDRARRRRRPSARRASGARAAAASRTGSPSRSSARRT